MKCMNKLVQIVPTNCLFYTTTEQKWFIGLIVYVFCKQSLVKFVCSAWVVGSFVSCMLMNDILDFIKTLIIGIQQNWNSDNLAVQNMNV